MTVGCRRPPKSLLKLMLTCLTVFSIALLLTSLITSPRNNAPSEVTKFDWAAYRKDGETPAGPKIGEKINLSRLKGRNGASLSASVGVSPIVLSIVGPGCGACREATDQMTMVRERITGKGIGYYVTTFNYLNEPEKFFRYVDSLGVEAQPFIWAVDDSQPPPSLVEMVVPSHLLVAHNGVVLQRWPGTNYQKEVRRRMAEQIVDEALQIVSEGKD